MAEEWYYGRNGKAVGPYEFGDIQLMVAARKLKAEDQVSSDGETWRPAGEVEGLDFGRSQAKGEAAVSYQTPVAGGLVMTVKAAKLLGQGCSWARVVAVIMLIYSGLMMLGGIVVLAYGASQRAIEQVATTGIVYLVTGILYAIPCLLLLRFVNRVGGFLKFHHERQLEDAMASHKLFWKYVAIFLLICVLIAIVGLAILVSLGMLMRFRHFAP